MSSGSWGSKISFPRRTDGNKMDIVCLINIELDGRMTMPRTENKTGTWVPETASKWEFNLYNQAKCQG